MISCLRTASIGGLVLGLMGCALTPTPDGVELGEVSTPLRGPTTFVGTSANGVVRITGTHARGPLQGALVAPDMVLTALPGLSSSSSNLDLTVTTRPTSRGDREQARVIDRVWLSRWSMVLLRLDLALQERPVVMDTAAYGTQPVRCNQLNADGGFTGGVFQAHALPDSTMLMLNGGAPGLVLDTVGGGDYGLVCGTAGFAKGILVYANAPVPGQEAIGLLANIADLGPFVQAQREVFAVREDGLATPFSLYVTENGARRCLQASGNALRALPCDPGNKQQEFYFDRRAASQNLGAPAIISAWRGACLSAPTLSLPSGSANVTTERCDQSRMQSFSLRFTASGHVQYMQNAFNRCLAATSLGTVVVGGCGESPARNWSISWLPQ